MEKFKTLNNRASRDLLNMACQGALRAVGYLLYNYRDTFEPEVYQRLFKAVCNIVGDDIYLIPNMQTLSLEVRYYMITLLNPKGGVEK